ncbi:MAG: hypothetical protein EHM19_13850 [Candidatus Latescibacterota bacterium]|nr:MAG: hypothetical protein EHM19_13850 [Candidatus Latescibacterota bacterium]
MNFEEKRPAPPGQSGFLDDLAALWLGPTRLFSSLRAAPRSRLALALLLVVVAAATLLTIDVLLATMKARGAEEVAARGGQGAESLRLLEHPATRIGIVLVSPATLLLVVVAHAVGGYILLMLTGGAEGEKPFMSLLRVVVWAKLVEVPRMLLWVPLVLVKRNAEVYFGPAAFLPGDADPRLLSVLGSLDLFSIWFLALLVLGIAVVMRVSRRRAAAAAILPWAVWVAVKAAGAGA